MKAVYISKTIWNINLKDGRVLTYDSDHDRGRYVYKYGDVPNDYIEVFNKETVWTDLLWKLRFEKDYHGSMTRFSKRVYIDDWDILCERIYKDELSAFEIQHIFKVVENPQIEYLEKDLGFKGYSELVFDREQELKSIMLKN